MSDETGGRIEGDLMSRRQAIALAAGSAGVLVGASAAEAEDRAATGRPTRRFDVVIIGGGPAGLSAALVFGRACRKVLVCDSGRGRNAPAAGVHGFFSQDGTPPAELRRIGRDQLKPYDVQFHSGTATEARPVEGGFEVTLDGAEVVACRKLILATGLVDVLPEIPGLQELWGTGVIHCPYCHGWEYRGRPWAFLTPKESVVETATLLFGWTKQLTLLTDGPAELSPEDRAWLEGQAVEVVEERIDRLEGGGGTLRAIHLASGRRIEPATLFVRTRLRQGASLPEALGCEFVGEGPTKGMVKTDPAGMTQVKGLYVVGDASSVGVPSVASAVAEGSMTAAVANMAMLTEDAPRRPGRRE
ncbi:NAD(P)/FAD-dependent oxidoreductase [Singulisphaera acidiphila]|uniref:Thioredoxin reductase n=1 Tax=Singulisphaera acidiphila (strain ATCC BAA-1392 / DSM 18658 / VKM B-2454 / MOB10) TaxID=886293 RepID=L0DHA3_SINAD|nr:NAD(P)/FAD-dependent oxidoreductase [Singulisphaera acidiphila]AGA28637.1 thioredoxin reductase [Singulisphaera acidiphila DSM 18658]